MSDLIAQLRDMHKPRTERRNSCCVQCGIVWPCPTRRVLDEGGAAAPSSPAGRAEVERLQDKILELEADLAKVKDLLRSENKRANDAIDRDGRYVLPFNGLQAAAELRRMADEAQQSRVCSHCSHPADWHDQWEGCVGPNGIGGAGSGDCTCTRSPGQAQQAGEGR